MSFSEPGHSEQNSAQSRSTERSTERSRELSLEGLKTLLSTQLCDPDRLKRPAGLATGFEPLDRFLLWGGVPKAGVTLFCGRLGTGATSLWMETAAGVIGTDAEKSGSWAAWINGETPLAPQSLYQKGMGLKRFVCIEKPSSEAKLFWALQELMSSSLFELIGCDLGALRLRESQIRKLQAQAREAQIALVFISQLKPYRGSAASVFSLIVHFEKKKISVARALHRPTPHEISRSVTYARFTLHTENRVLPYESQTDRRSSHDPYSDSSSLPPAAKTSFDRI